MNEPSLWDYVRAWIARRLPPGWRPATWWRDDAWMRAIHEAAEAQLRRASAQGAAGPAAGPTPTQGADIARTTPPHQAPDAMPSAPAAPAAAPATAPDARHATATPDEGLAPPAAMPPPAQPTSPPGTRSTRRSLPWAWALGAALGLALFAQAHLEPPQRAWPVALAVYGLMAVGLSGYVLRRWPATGAPPDDTPAPEAEPWRVTTTRVRLPGLALAAGLLTMTFVLAGGNRFTRLNITTWALGTLALAWGLGADVLAWPRWLAPRLRHGLAVRLTPFRLLVLAVLLVGVFWRFYRLGDVPPEMTSDHAEKLYDVMDVLAGQWRVFFPRNAGREPIQMYLTALFARVAGTGIHFLSLKLATAVGALALLPTMYALGRTWQDRETGLWAMALVGVAYWLQVITRAALRFVFYPLFAALTLLFLLRGFQRGRATDFLWAGVFLGAGLYGYTSFRLMPVVVLATFLWYALHQRRAPKRELLAALVLMGLMALALAIPMFRYMLDEPQWFFYRSMTRLSTLERPYPDAPWRVFAHNVFRAAVMFWWDNGEVWLASVPKRPALDWVAAALMTLGMVLIGLRYARTRRWQDGWWFLLIPLLQLPSSLALAFPNENPNLYRAGAALIPAFLFAAAGLRAVRRAWDAWRRPLGTLAAVALWLWSMAASYHLVFDEYQRLYRLSTWNASDMGRVIGGFARSVGEPDQAWVVPYPFWVDTRLVGIWAGYPGRDYALFPDHLETTLDVPAPKLFLLKPEDQATLERLWALYPQGRVWRYRSPVEGKDFLMYFVPTDEPPRAAK